MMCPDNFARYEQHEAEQERWLASRPTCDHCKEKIQDEDLIEIDGYLYHEDCFVEKYTKEHRQCTDNYAS